MAEGGEKGSKGPGSGRHDESWFNSAKERATILPYFGSFSKESLDHPLQKEMNLSHNSLQ